MRPLGDLIASGADDSWGEVIGWTQASERHVEILGIPPARRRGHAPLRASHDPFSDGRGRLSLRGHPSTAAGCASSVRAATRSAAFERGTRASVERRWSLQSATPFWSLVMPSAAGSRSMAAAGPTDSAASATSPPMRPAGRGWTWGTPNCCSGRYRTRSISSTRASDGPGGKVRSRHLEPTVHFLCTRRLASRRRRSVVGRAVPCPSASSGRSITRWRHRPLILRAARRSSS